jgi:dCTP deaminase
LINVDKPSETALSRRVELHELGNANRKEPARGKYHSEMSFVTDNRDPLLPLEIPDDNLSLNSGILPAQWIKRLADRGQIDGKPLERGQIQPASLDLRLGKVGYKIHASFLPGHSSSVQQRIWQLTSYELDLTTPQILTRGSVYLVEIEEVLKLGGTISAIANPKSSTGRLDVFTRIIADQSDAFDVVPPAYVGKLWAEISPRTFDVMVRRGTRLAQLRFRRRTSSQHVHSNFRLNDTELEALHEKSRVTDETPIFRQGLNLRVNLRRDNGSNVIAYRAKRYTSFIDMDKVGYYKVTDYWDPVEPTAEGNLLLSPGEFYILASKEKLHIPADHAAEMVAVDPIMGEFRVHYAGFFDPGFGCTRDDGPGSKAVLEVRTYDIPFFLEDGQTIGRLAFEHLTEKPSAEYGDAIASNYQGQRLKLSKHFLSP